MLSEERVLFKELNELHIIIFFLYKYWKECSYGLYTFLGHQKKKEKN